MCKAAGRAEQCTHYGLHRWGYRGKGQGSHCSCSCQAHSTAARKAAEPRAGRTMERSLLRSSALSVAAMPDGMLVPAHAHDTFGAESVLLPEVRFEQTLTEGVIEHALHRGMFAGVR